MSNMKKKKNIIISVFSLLLCVLITFAWFNDEQHPEGRVMEFKLTNASVSDSELVITLSANVEENKFEDITKIYKEGEPAQKLESFEEFSPGSRQRFRVDITNNSETSVRLRMLLSEIVCDSEELRENIIIGTNGFEGFDSNYPAPLVQNQLLSEGIDESGYFSLVDVVEIPPNEKTVSIYFYVMFTASGSANLEDQTFSIGKINFLTV